VTASYMKLTDAAIRAATLPSGKSQHYLHDTEQPGLAIRMRATGGRTWVYMFTKPGMKGTQRKTLGAWPKFNEKAARQAATIAAGEVVKGATRTRPSGNSWPRGSAPRWRP
jgi:Arm DNA-binding domain